MKLLIVILGLYLVIDYSLQLKPSVGEVWPKPEFVRKKQNFFKINPHGFDFVAIGYTCDILQNALIRYKEILQLSVNSVIKHKNETFNYQSSGTIKKVFVNLTAVCESLPHLQMDESYYIATESSRIMANSIWGILRGLETFSQLLTPDSYEILWVPNIRIRDKPRFPHRGLLLDTSRHYISVDKIFTILDGMAYNKLNVFHWHIVDDESFPYQSIKYPELSEKGAYSLSMIYTQKDILNIIEYARMRGIRIVAEFDVPAHSRSWGNSHPEILIDCKWKNWGPMHLGPMNPIENATYNLLRSFFSEVLELFPDKFMHIGGDEVGSECLSRNYKIKDYLKINNIDYQYLQHRIVEFVADLLTKKNFTPIVWQEAMDVNVNMPKDTIIQVWKQSWRPDLVLLTSFGYRILLSACWYLDYLDLYWFDYYNCEPLHFHGNAKQKELVIGGEACMWTEDVNSCNVIPRIFPKVSAVAEILWSTRQSCMRRVSARLEEHTCRMILRGVPVQPLNGPGIC